MKDRYNEEYFVWGFKSTPELWAAITEYSHRSKE